MDDLKTKYPTLTLCEKLNIPVEYVGDDFTEEQFAGPIWDGKKIVYADDGYGDIGFFHEIAHWAVARNWERRCPDYALGRHVNASLLEKDTIENNDFQHGVYEKSIHGMQPSWANERRLPADIAGLRESAAVVAMLLYPLIFPDTKEDWYGAAIDFSVFATEINTDIMKEVYRICDVFGIDHTEARRQIKRLEKTNAGY